MKAKVVIKYSKFLNFSPSNLIDNKKDIKKTINKNKSIINNYETSQFLAYILLTDKVIIK